MQVALASTPLDLMDAETVDVDGNALNLDSGTTYSIQAEIPAGGGGPEYIAISGPFVHLDDKSAAPANTGSAGRKLRHLETVRAKAGEDGKLWAWVTSGPAIVNVYEEA